VCLKNINRSFEAYLLKEANIKAENVLKQFGIYLEECLELLDVFSSRYKLLFKHRVHILFLPMEERRFLLSVLFLIATCTTAPSLKLTHSVNEF
jgi:hypothetical protein